jgi:hypothetical protein
MAYDTWEDVAGHKCSGCGKYATHFYGSYGAICCDCHGGYLVSQKDAKKEHERVILKQDDEDHKKIRKNEVDFPDEIEEF